MTLLLQLKNTMEIRQMQSKTQSKTLDGVITNKFITVNLGRSMKTKIYTNTFRFE